MKLHLTFILAALATLLMGCSSPDMKMETDAPDGIYIEATDSGRNYALRVASTRGVAQTFRIRQYSDFLPEGVLVFESDGYYYVQVDGRAVVEDWMNESIVIVAKGVPYVQMSKSGQAVAESGERVGPSATISLVLRTREEAETIASSLRERYSLSF